MGSYTDERSPPGPSDLLFRAATALVFVGIGAFAGYGSQAFSGLSQVFLSLVPFVSFPAAVLLFAKRTFRIFLFVIALVFCFAMPEFVDVGGADNTMVVFPFIGFWLAAGAALAEMAMLLRRLMRGRPRPEEI